MANLPLYRGIFKRTPEALITNPFQCASCGTPLTTHNQNLQKGLPGLCFSNCETPSNLSDIPLSDEFPRYNTCFLVDTNTLEAFQAPIISYTSVKRAGLMAEVGGVNHPILVWPYRNGLQYYVFFTVYELNTVMQRIINLRLNQKDIWSQSYSEEEEAWKTKLCMLMIDARNKKYPIKALPVEDA